MDVKFDVQQNFNVPLQAQALLNKYQRLKYQQDLQAFKLQNPLSKKPLPCILIIENIKPSPKLLKLLDKQLNLYYIQNNILQKMPQAQVLQTLKSSQQQYTKACSITPYQQNISSYTNYSAALQQLVDQHLQANKSQILCQKAQISDVELQLPCQILYSDSQIDIINQLQMKLNINNQSQRIIQLDNQLYTKAKQASNLESIQSLNQIGQFQVIKQNIFHIYTVIKCLNVKLSDLQQKAKQFSLDVLNVTLSNNNVIIPYFSERETQNDGNEQALETKQVQSKSIVQSALKRLRYVQFASQFVKDPNEFINKQINKQMIRKRFLLGAKKDLFIQQQIFDDSTVLQSYNTFNSSIFQLGDQVLINKQK